ncbi:MAG: Holliday junction resolvase RuvX [Synergistaceae bacterium]|jgi:putative Holliday junction resolvase|nr:Holliday junction resolvase RuvX [Synergistaceae bacterium]
MGRIIALDVGSVRIGVAVSDPLGSFAQGLTVLQAASDWMEELSPLITEYAAHTLLVGMPLRTNGSIGPEALAMRDVIQSLSERFPGCRVIHWDERFTTAIANQALIEADVSRKGRKGQVDKVAAALLLQSYLDSRRPGPPGAEFTAASEALPDARRGRRGKSAYD